MGILETSHIAFGVLALGCGLVTLSRAKGTGMHKVLGYGYVISMIGLNVTALQIYKVFKYFGPFHVLAVLSLVTLLAGFLPAYSKKPKGKWVSRHYEGMCWSYVGLLAATAAEIAVRLPFVKGFGPAFGVATFISSVVVVTIGALVLYRLRDRTLSSLGSRKEDETAIP